MGDVREDITLKNAIDLGLAGRGIIKEEDVRTITVKALADTGAWTLILTEETFRKLGLGIVSQSKSTVAGGGRKDSFKAEPVRVQWKDRFTTIDPVVLPGETENLLGTLPLEGMDLMVDPVRQRVVGAHGDEWVQYIRLADAIAE